LEELYWQQRGGVVWILEGDSNSQFFHLYANGRRRKKIIVSLANHGEIRSQEDIMMHATNFYKNLFGSQPLWFGNLNLSADFWNNRHTLSEEERDKLKESFREAKVKEAIFNMKVDTSPGPNGFEVQFLKAF
jgi:hypothetical protein